MDQLVNLQGPLAGIAVILGVISAAWLYALIKRWSGAARPPMHQPVSNDRGQSTIAPSYPALDPKYAREAVATPISWSDPRIPLREQRPNYRKNGQVRSYSGRNPTTGEMRSQQSPAERSAERAVSSRLGTSGTIYLHSNGRFVKIGMTVHSSKGRMRSYAKSHKLVGSYHLVREWPNVKNFGAVERAIHLNLGEHRISHGIRELYSLSADAAIVEIERALRNAATDQF